MLHAQEKKISIHSENNQVIDATSDPATQYLNGDVKVYHEGTFMYCDTAVLRGNDLRTYFNVVLLQNDTIKIFADSLHYNGDSLVAYLYGDIILENGPDKKLYTSYLKYDVKNKIAYYTKNAKLIDKNAVLISKRGTYHLNDKTAFFYQNVKITGDDFELVGDSVSYNTITQLSTFLSPVRITKDSSNIYSQKGWFNLGNKIGDFIGNAQYLKNKTQARADTISYNGELDQITLKGDKILSEYISESDTAYAKVIFYDQKKETFKLTTNSYYKGANNEVKGDHIFYDKITEKFNVTGRSSVSDPPTIIEADTLDYDKRIKFGKADGHVIWRDTSAKTAIYADHVLYNGKDNFMKATNDTLRPMFTVDLDNDTLFLKADTLRSFRVIKEKLILPDKNAARRLNSTQKDKPKQVVDFSENQISNVTTGIDTSLHTTNDSSLQSHITDTIFTGIMDTLDYFIGDNNVKIYKSDMQAVSDSLVYNKKDSIFILFQKPFVWSDSTQISGDTLDIYMKNKKMDKLKVHSQATILNSIDLKYFNQIQGRFLEALFKDNKIYKMDVNGNAQIVYYLTDSEKAYIGVNTTESSYMSFLLKENKVTDIRNYVEPKSTVYPMNTVDHEAIKVKGFNWNIKARPLSKADL